MLLVSCKKQAVLFLKITGHFESYEVVKIDK